MSSLDLSKLDLNRLEADITGALANGLSDLVQGTAADLQKFAAAITNDMLEAQLTGNQVVVDVVLAQLSVIAEINRVRVENHTWIVVQSVTKAIFAAAIAGAASVLL